METPPTIRADQTEWNFASAPALQFKLLPYLGWQKRPWVPEWLWRRVAFKSVEDSLRDAIQRSERALGLSLSKNLYGEK